MLKLRGNNLTDPFVFTLLNQEFRQITVIDLSYNHLLTSDAIEAMTNRTYPELTHLILDAT